MSSLVRAIEGKFEGKQAWCELESRVTYIYGPNGSGKSRFFAGVYWDWAIDAKAIWS